MAKGTTRARSIKRGVSYGEQLRYEMKEKRERDAMKGNMAASKKAAAKKAKASSKTKKQATAQTALHDKYGTITGREAKSKRRK